VIPETYECEESLLDAEKPDIYGEIQDILVDIEK
jgi:hypothetical protein